MQFDSYSRNLLSQPSNNWQELSLLRSFWFVIKSPTLKLLQSGVHVACSNWSACELPGNHQPCYQYLFILLFQSKHAASYWIRCSSYGLWFVSSTVFSRRYVLATNNVMAILVDKFVYCACHLCCWLAVLLCIWWRLRLSNSILCELLIRQPEQNMTDWHLGNKSNPLVIWSVQCSQHLLKITILFVIHTRQLLHNFVLKTGLVMSSRHSLHVFFSLWQVNSLQ